MSTSFKKFRLVDRKTKLLTSGYIRNAELLFPNNNPYYNVVELINHTITIYYYDGIIFNKNPNKKDGEQIIFIDDITMKKIHNSWRTCIVDIELNNKMCDLFTISFKVIYLSRHATEFFFGYFSVESSDELDYITYNHWIRGSNNKMLGTAVKNEDKYIYVYADNVYKNFLNPLGRSLMNGDIFKIKFDFINKESSFYVNQHNIHTQPMGNKNIFVPAISPFWNCQQFKIDSWSFS